MCDIIHKTTSQILITKPYVSLDKYVGVQFD